MHEGYRCCLKMERDDHDEKQWYESFTMEDVKSHGKVEKPEWCSRRSGAAGGMSGSCLIKMICQMWTYFSSRYFSLSV